MDQSLKLISRPRADTDDSKLPARRWLVLALNLVSIVVLASAMTMVLGERGWSAPTATFFILYLIGLPWTLLGFWNSVIGFMVLRLAKDPAGYVNPALRNTPPDGVIFTRTALCLAIRNEEVAATFARLGVMLDSLKATGHADAFDVHILSDTDRPAVAAQEEAAFAAAKARFPGVGLHYRRRPDNAGFKAGNLEEFAIRCRARYEHMIVLDADSMMSGRAMLRLVRAMQANPRLGILQTLVVGRPSKSGFTRIFQFGMRHGMRAQTTGSAWWQGSSGPYWGHNAIIRIAPFVDHCQLPTVPGRPPLGGPVLSHDQVEAALMRGAGYEVRVIPDEYESWEENPPNLPDFIQRDLRWCQGNLQYLRLLRMPGLNAMGRFQLVNAIMMYAGAPMSFLMLMSGLAIAATPGSMDRGAAAAFGLYLTMMALGFAPRVIGVADILLRGDARRYGGARRLMAGCGLDVVFSLLIGPVMMITQTVFIVGLAFGRRVVWDAQNRADRSVGWGEAVRGLWPQVLFSGVGAAALWSAEPVAMMWAIPTLLPCLLAPAFTCVTASGPFTRLLNRSRLCAIPDEIDPAPILRAATRQEGLSAPAAQTPAARVMEPA